MDRGTRGVSQAGRTRDSRCYSVPAISGTPPEGTGNMLEAGGDQIDLEFALKPPLSSSKAKTQETINSLFKCPNRRNNSPRWCLSDHWTPENVAELYISSGENALPLKVGRRPFSHVFLYGALFKL